MTNHTGRALASNGFDPSAEPETSIDQGRRHVLTVDLGAHLSVGQPRDLLGLLELTADRLKLTRRGLLVSDSIWPAFL